MSERALPGEPAGRIVVFQEHSIRRTWHNEKSWFAIVDVVAVLTDSVQPKGCVKDLRRRDNGLAKGWGQIAPTPFGWKPRVAFRGVTAPSPKGCFASSRPLPHP